MVLKVGRGMEFLVIVGLAVVALVVLPSLLADEKTKLFRRIWSTERTGPNSVTTDAQHEAVAKLLVMYGANKSGDPGSLRESIAALMADALTFDIRHPRNGGVEITKVLARHIRIRFPNLGD